MSWPASDTLQLVNKAVIYEEARVKHTWTPAEREKLRQFINDPAYQHRQGKPNWSKIGKAMNLPPRACRSQGQAQEFKPAPASTSLPPAPLQPPAPPTLALPRPVSPDGKSLLDVQGDADFGLAMHTIMGVRRPTSEPALDGSDGSDEDLCKVLDKSYDDDDDDDVLRSLAAPGPSISYRSLAVRTSEQPAPSTVSLEAQLGALTLSSANRAMEVR